MAPYSNLPCHLTPTSDRRIAAQPPYSLIMIWPRWNQVTMMIDYRREQRNLSLQHTFAASSLIRTWAKLFWSTFTWFPMRSPLSRPQHTFYYTVDIFSQQLGYRNSGIIRLTAYFFVAQSRQLTSFWTRHENIMIFVCRPLTFAGETTSYWYDSM